MKVEAMELWGMLWFAHYLDIPTLHIYGDSQTIINHVLGIPSIQQGHLMGWLRNIGHLMGTFRETSIQHIRRSHNSAADALSKLGIDATQDGPAHRDDRGWLFT